jgi:hypothetical protein
MQGGVPSGRIGSSPHPELINAGAANQRAMSPQAASSGNPFAGSIDANQQAAANAHSLETLDEPVSATLLRDLRKVAVKLKHVLIPKDTVKELRDCQTWAESTAEKS